MPITILRWKSGSGGDTLLRMLLDSNPIHSQNKYLGTDIKTNIDPEYVTSFRYREIAAMSLQNAALVDRQLLANELQGLDRENRHRNWLLKSHCYWNMEYPTIDIEIDPALMPFVVKASLHKNNRSEGFVSNYHPLIGKIRDPKVLYSFDCYNYAKDICNLPSFTTGIALSCILGSWPKLQKAVNGLGYNLSHRCRPIYDAWLAANRRLIPSDIWRERWNDPTLDVEDPRLSLEEKYCLLAKRNQPFQIYHHV